MRTVRRIVSGLVVAGLCLSSTGCMKKILLDGQIKNTRRGSEAISTLHDFEIAQQMARTGIAMLEGMHELAPYNEDALFMLTRAWVGATYAFTEDEWERAKLGDHDVFTRYQLERTVAGYTRARFYGIELLTRRAHDFQKAKKNAEAIKVWMQDNYTHPDYAEELLWIGSAWLNHINADRSPEVIGEMHVGVEIVRRSVELDDTIEYGLGRTILGAYHARTAMAELDESKRQFDLALKINKGKLLQTKFLMATRYYCAKADKENYERLLNEILEAGDILPDRRLNNVIAKRRAFRHLHNEALQEDCGFRGVDG